MAAMVRKEFILDAEAGTRLIEVRHEMQRGLSVSRYELSTTGRTAACQFTTLRKARAAFRAQVAEARSGVPTGSKGG